MASAKRNFGNPLAGNEKYCKLEDLSSGSFGFVQKCQNLQNGKIVAIKFLKRGEAITEYVEREVVTQASLAHPHIVGFKEVFCTRTHLAIVLEFVPGGDVLQHILKKGSLTENEVRRIFQQLVIAVDFLHRRGIVNRDIKLENTMLDGGALPLVKVTDLGLCKSQEDSAPKSRVGTPGCMAPEVLKSHFYSGEIADAWSCGVMLFAMLFGAYPFERLCDQYRPGPSAIREIWRRISELDYDIPDTPAASDSAKDLIRRILVLDPAARMTIAQIQEHPWFKVGVPEGVKDMNDKHMKVNPHDRSGYQSVKAIREVIRQARMEEDMPLAHAASTDSDISESLPMRQLRVPQLQNRSDSRALV